MIYSKPASVPPRILPSRLSATLTNSSSVTPLAATLTNDLRVLPCFGRNRLPVNPLSATFTAHLVSVANKELVGTLSPLDATLTKNTGGPLPFLKFHFNFHSPSQPRGSFSTESAGPSAGSNSRCTPDPASSSCRTTDAAAAPPGSSPPLERSLTAAIHRCCTSSAIARTASCAGRSPS